MATREFTVEWEDEGEPDYDENGNESGYLKLMTGFRHLGVEITDEREL